MNKSLTKQKQLSLIPLTMSDISDQTKRTYSFSLRAYERYLKNSRSSPGIDSIFEWIESVPEPRTQHVYIAAVKKVLREIYLKDPRFPELNTKLSLFKPVRIDRTVKEAEYLKKVFIDALIKGTPKRLSLMIEALFWTGCRISELLSIKLARVQVQGRTIAIEIIGKGRKQRTVYMKRSLFKKINKVFQGAEYLFEHNGKSYNRNYITRQIKKAGKEIINRKISAHTLRHSKAMYMKDVLKLTPDKIQKALGHESVQTTLEHYFHGSPTAKEQGI